MLQESTWLINMHDVCKVHLRQVNDTKQLQKSDAVSRKRKWKETSSEVKHLISKCLAALSSRSESSTQRAHESLHSMHPNLNI